MLNREGANGNQGQGRKEKLERTDSQEKSNKAAKERQTLEKIIILMPWNLEIRISWFEKKSEYNL